MSHTTKQRKLWLVGGTQADSERVREDRLAWAANRSLACRVEMTHPPHPSGYVICEARDSRLTRATQHVYRDVREAYYVMSQLREMHRRPYVVARFAELTGEDVA